MNKKWKQELRKTGSIIVSIALLGNLTACGAESSGYAEAGDILNMEEETLKEVLTASVAPAHSSTDGKEEIVYVLADAEGGVNKVIVSDWLKNGSGTGEIADFTKLDGIENVKGEETFSRDGNTVLWDTDGSDIYYQGTTREEVPVQVKISYTLDGKRMTPDEIAGKSGKVIIRLDYENNAYQKAEAGGKEIDIQVPFAMLSGMILPQDTFSNISVTNGRIISEGNNSIVAGIAFPGLKESLKLDTLENKLTKVEDFEIPDYLEITADVVNFEMGMTMTVAMSDLLSDQNLTETFSVRDLSDSVNQLEGGTAELKDGSVSLEDGSKTLADGTVSLLDGARTLREGSGTLKDGTKELYEKSGQLDEGARKLQDGTGQLTEGASKLADGAGSLSQGAGQLGSGAQALAGGLEQVDAGIKMLQAALETGSATQQGQQPAILAGSQSVTEAAAALDTLINEYFSTYAASLNTIIDNVLKQINNTTAALNAARAEKENAEAERDAAKAVWEEVCNGEVRQIETVTNVPNDVSGGDAAVITEVSNFTVCQPETLKDAARNYEAAEEKAAVCQANVSALEEKITQLQEQLAQLQEILQQNTPLNAEQSEQGAYIALIKTYSGQIANGTASLNQGLKLLDAGVRQMASETEGVPALKSGAQSLQSGAEAVKNGSDVLSKGAGELKGGIISLGNGAAELKAGTGKLVEGTGTLHNGAKTLADGTAALYDGAAALKDGAEELSAGCLALKDGLFRFDEEGISKLTELAGEDTGEVFERLEAVLDAGKAYKTFGGLAEGMDGSVKFIIKTDGVKAK